GREILLALGVRAGHAGIAVPVVAELRPDLDLAAIDPGRLHPVPKKRLRPPIAIRIAIVKERDPLLERKRAEPVAILLRVMPPPVHAKDPAAQRDGRDIKIGVTKLPAFHHFAPVFFRTSPLFPLRVARAVSSA